MKLLTLECANIQHRRTRCTLQCAGNNVWLALNTRSTTALPLSLARHCSQLQHQLTRHHRRARSAAYRPARWCCAQAKDKQLEQQPRRALRACAGVLSHQREMGLQSALQCRCSREERIAASAARKKRCPERAQPRQSSPAPTPKKSFANPVTEFSAPTPRFLSPFPPPVPEPQSPLTTPQPPTHQLVVTPRP